MNGTRVSVADIPARVLYNLSTIIIIKKLYTISKNVH